VIDFKGLSVSISHLRDERGTSVASMFGVHVTWRERVRRCSGIQARVSVARRLAVLLSCPLLLKARLKPVHLRVYSTRHPLSPGSKYRAAYNSVNL